MSDRVAYRRVETLLLTAIDDLPQELWLAICDYQLRNYGRLPRYVLLGEIELRGLLDYSHRAKLPIINVLVADERNMTVFGVTIVRVCVRSFCDIVG